VNRALKVLNFAFNPFVPFLSSTQTASLDAQCSHSLIRTSFHTTPPRFLFTNHLTSRSSLLRLLARTHSHLQKLPPAIFIITGTPPITSKTATTTTAATMINFFMICTMLVLALCGPASAHIKMAFPVPFDAANLDTSPLQASGADYPCKKSSYKITAMNKIPVDQAVLLDFKGSATHNGGTCQLSISLDKEPTADSTFKVIQTFEGGCPTAEGAGGLTFNIPKEFPNTERATLAWTWFNQIGNREMYMNCAPIEVTGGSDNHDYYNSLPDMFKANIGIGGCTTAESGDPTLPDPGQFLIKSKTVKPLDVSCSSGAAGSQSKQQTPTVPNLAAYGPPAKDANQIEYVDGSTGGGSGSGSGGASSSAPGGNNGQYSQPAASPAQPSSAPTASYNNGQYSQPVASPAQPTSTAVSSAAPSATVPASSSTFSTMTVPASRTAPSAYPTLSPTLGQGLSGPSTGSAASTGSSSSSSGSTGSAGQSPGSSAYNGSPSSSSGSAGSSGQCTTDGAIVCNGPTQFGLCGHGSVVWQAVAAGTTCSSGAILKRSQPVMPPLPRHHARGFHKVRNL
jgi:hypothetical protein